ncbi:MAG: glyceraldehyde 3-phosphate dehydrogenase NAD-binding domain-containing protein, partial [Candidatus Thorarchaeota archaeon]
MTVRVGINGFGRIGRGFLRSALSKNEFEVVALNDLMDLKSLAHLMKYDTVMGRYEGSVEADNDTLTVEGQQMRVVSERDPANLPWKDMGVDIVAECTGFFRKREDAEKHISAGVKKVVLSAPGKGGEMRTVVLGVNHEDYDPAKDDVISNAS